MLRRIKNLILHRQPAVNNLTSGPWLKRSSGGADAPGIWVGMYSYTTPTTGVAPISGEIVHSNNIVNKLSISHFDMNGRNLASAIAQMTTGDFIKVGGTTFDIISPVLQDASGTFSYITISPTTQLPDAIYPVILRKEGVEEPTEPINTVAPVISGSLNVGMVLSCSTGTWTGLTPITYTYEWLSDGIEVPGATSSSYVLQSSDVGNLMSCVVTASNKLGTGNEVSNELGPVLVAAPANTVAPTVTGDATVGNLLTSTNGSWTGSPTSYAYQWLRNGSPISGATSNTYTTVAGDVATSVACRVTATNSGGSGSATSNALTITAAIIPPPVNTVAPAVTGNAQVGSLLTCSQGTWTGEAPITYVYQWKADTINIAGATSQIYTTVAGDVGKTITCRVTATNVGGATIATSNGVVVVDEFSPEELFAAGEKGAWYDPSDFSTMFQDSAGTTPVTAVGQPVGRILDKSGNNNHATQATTASRPVLQQDGDGKYYLGFDGVDDLLKTPAFLTNGGSHAVTVSAGLLRSSTGNGVVIQSSNDELCNNGWGVQAGLYDGNQWGARLGVGADLFVAVANIVTTAKQTISIQFDTDGATYNDDLIYKINNIRQTLAGSLNNPSGALPEYQLYIGSFDSLFSAAMRMYASVILFRKMTTQEAIDTEAWVNGKTGAY